MKIPSVPLECFIRCKRPRGYFIPSLGNEYQLLGLNLDGLELIQVASGRTVG